MLIFIGKGYEEMNLSPEEMQAQMGKWFAWNAKMEEAGVVESGDALTSTIKRISGSDRTVTDRTATEVKELIGGYYIVKAENIEGAIAIAQDYPDYDHGGTVEVREIMVFEQ